MSSNMFADEQGDAKMDKQEDRTAEYIEMEREVHPWASDAILRKIVEDELKLNPNYYDEEMEEGEEAEHDDVGEKPGITIVIGHKPKKGPVKDPFEEDEEDEEATEE